MNNAPTVQETKNLTISDALSEMGVSASDIVIPRLLLMQNTSEFVGEEKAKLGDLVNSSDYEVLGGFNEPMEVIPLKFFKTWKIYDTTGKLVRQEPATNNERRAIETMENGQMVRHYLSYNYFLLSVKQFEQGVAFPMLISFKSTAAMAGRQLATHLLKLATFGKHCYDATITINVKKAKKDSNTYAVPEIGKGRALQSDTDAELISEAKRWIEVLSTMNYTVAEEKETHDSVATPTVTPGVTPVAPEDLF